MKGRVWGDITSNIDWCEENHAQSEFIAEWFNTWSNVPGILVGLAYLAKSLAHHKPFPPMVVAMHASLLTVFVGSFAFHATLLRPAQLLDELPMIVGSGIFLSNMFDYQRDLRAVGTVIALSAASVLWVVVQDDNPYALQVSYGSLVALLVIRSTIICRQPQCPRAQLRLFAAAVAMYGGGFVLWLVDRHGCEDVGHIYGHAVWHVGAAIGTAAWIQFCVFFQVRARGGEAHIHWLAGLFPFVEPAEANFDWAGKGKMV